MNGAAAERAANGGDVVSCQPLGQLLGERTHELWPEEHRLEIEPQIAVVARFETKVAATRSE